MPEHKPTKIKILKAAKELFIDNGYHDTSMAAIAEMADLGKGTLYWHFDSKSELFQSMISREVKIIFDELNKLSNADLKAEEILKKFIKIRLIRIMEYKKTTQMFMDSENFVNDEFKKTMLELFESFIGLLTDTIKQGIEEGVFYTENPEKTAIAFLGMINGICTATLLNDEESMDIEKTTSFIYDLFLNGLKIKKGENNID